MAWLTPHEAMRHAILKVGSQAAFARLIGVSQPAVNAWVNQQKELPGDYVIAVERETGVPRWQLRPDLYPPEEYAATDERAPPDAALDHCPRSQEQSA